MEKIESAKMRGVNTKIVYGFLIVAVVFLLIISGSVNAFALELKNLKDSVKVGEIVKFVVSLKLETDENVNVDKFILELNNSDDGIKSCSFLPSGEIISGCSGITIEKTSSPDNSSYGGYCPGYSGYESCENIFSYNISWNTTDYSPGEYKTKIILFSGEETSESAGGNVTLLSDISFKRCSLRGENGLLTVKGINVTNSRINFFVPLSSSAAEGKGFLMSTKGASKFSYKFDTVGIIENSESRSKILVSGSFKLGREKEIKETAIITLDKKNQIVSLVGKNIVLKNSDITFMQGC
jgi:hypothetical protein